MDSDRWSKPQPKSPGGTNLTEDPSAIGSEELKEHQQTTQPRSHSPRFEEQNSEINLINLQFAAAPQAIGLPQYKLQVPFHVTCNKITEVFIKTSKSRSFQVIEQANNIATAVYKEKMSFRELIVCCFTPRPPTPKAVSAVRLHIGVNEKKCKRTVLVKGIYGSAETIMSFLTAFKELMENAANSPRSTRSSSVRSLPDMQYEPLTSEKTVDEDDFSLTIKNESASYYQFHKILSSESYTLGKTISQFIATFQQQHSNPAESVELLPAHVLFT